MRRAAAQAPLQIGTTPVILDEQIGLLSRWQRYLEERLDRTVRFVQRGSYREIMDLLLNDSIDVAWVCGYPYVTSQDRLRLLAVPLYQQKPLYRSYLIVPEADRSSRQIADLRNRVFAFSDPRSNSGYLVPRTELLRSHSAAAAILQALLLHLRPSQGRRSRTGRPCRRRPVDGYVWDTLAAQRPATDAGGASGLAIAGVCVSRPSSRDAPWTLRRPRRVKKRCWTCRRTKQGGGS